METLQIKIDQLVVQFEERGSKFTGSSIIGALPVRT